MMNKNIKRAYVQQAIEYVLLLTGCLVIALSFNFFLFPHKIASGGIPGLSVVLNKLLGINVAYIQYGVNLPLFIVGILKYGKNFGAKTALGTFAIPMFILLTQKFPIFSSNILIASMLGGAGTGIGLGLIINSRSAVCGFSLVAQLLHDYTKMKISKLIVLLNLFVLVAAGITFGFAGAVYAFLALIITGLLIDVVSFLFKKITLSQKAGCENVQ
jgi:uncharacterized membrane-anchored protein YitT (DUF2179 family)